MARRWEVHAVGLTSMILPVNTFVPGLGER